MKEVAHPSPQHRGTLPAFLLLDTSLWPWPPGWRPYQGPAPPTLSSTRHMPTSRWLILESVRESPESRFHQDLRLLGASSCGSNKQRGDRPCPSPGDRRHSGRPRRPNLPRTCRVRPSASGARLLEGAGGAGPRRFPPGPARTSTGRGDRKEAAPDGGLFGNAPLRAFRSRLQRRPQRPRLHLLAREPHACTCPEPHRTRGHEVSSPAAHVCSLSRSWLAEGEGPGASAEEPEETADQTQLSTRGDPEAGWPPVPLPALRPRVSVQGAYRESEASTLRHALVDGRGALWPGTDELGPRPCSHLAGGQKLRLPSARRLRSSPGMARGVGACPRPPGPHLPSAPPRILHPALQAAAADRTLQREG